MTNSKQWLAGADVLMDVARDVTSLLLPCGFVAIPNAPTTLAGTLQAWGERTSQPFPVSSLHSDQTIFGRPEGNYLFRAWHDSHHAMLRAEFDRAGELAVHAAMRADLAAWCGRHSAGVAHIDVQRAHELLECENIGQLDHWERLGAPPGDQRAFALGYLAAHGLL